MRFMAQSTDNDAPMIVALGRSLLSDGDPRRRQVLDSISSTLGRGTETPVSRRVSVHLLGDLVAVKIVPDTEDAAGRAAPLVGAVGLSEVGGEGWPDELAREFSWFGDAVGRPVDPALAEEARQAAVVIKKKATAYRTYRTLLVVGLGTLGLAALLALLLWWTKQ